MRNLILIAALTVSLGGEVWCLGGSLTQKEQDPSSSISAEKDLFADYFTYELGVFLEKVLVPLNQKTHRYVNIAVSLDQGGETPDVHLIRPCFEGKKFFNKIPIKSQEKIFWDKQYGSMWADAYDKMNHVALYASIAYLEFRLCLSNMVQNSGELQGEEYKQFDEKYKHFHAVNQLNMRKILK